MKVSRITSRRRRIFSQRRKQLVQELEDMEPFCRGSLHAFRVKKNNARKTSGRRKRTEYRQYYNWEESVDGRRTSRTLRIEQVEYIRVGIARYEAFREWQKSFVKAMEEEYLSTPEWEATAVGKKRAPDTKKTA